VPPRGDVTLVMGFVGSLPHTRVPIYNAGQGESGRDGLDLVQPRGRDQENKPPLLGCFCGAVEEVVYKSGLLMVS
jgi:hypothetical protein